MRSARWSASSRYCVVRKIVTPSAARSRMLSHTARRLRGSSPVVGSSRKITCGEPARVIARSSRRRIPPEYVDTCRPAASTRSNRSSSSATRILPASRPRWFRSAIRRRFSSPVSKSSTAENWPVTPIAARTPPGSPATSWPATRSSPPSARDQRRQDPHDRRLAGAVRPQQSEDRSLRDCEVDPVEDDLVAERLARPSPPRWPVVAHALGPSPRAACRRPRAPRDVNPRVPQQREPRRQELAERLHLQQHRLPLRRRVRNDLQPSRARSRSSWYSVVSIPWPAAS